MKTKCIWYVVYTTNSLIEEPYECARYRSFEAAERYCKRIADGIEKDAAWRHLFPKFQIKIEEYA